MPYSNNNFGDFLKVLTDSPYFEHHEDSLPVPPPSNNYLFQDGTQFQFQDLSTYLFN